MKLLVTGSRELPWSAAAWLAAHVDHAIRVFGLTDDVTIVHGGAKGADQMVDRLARNRGWKVDVYPADWDTFGKAAGAIRNDQMVRAATPDACLALLVDGAECRGTRDCLTKILAPARPIPVLVGVWRGSALSRVVVPLRPAAESAIPRPTFDPYAGDEPGQADLLKRARNGGL